MRKMLRVDVANPTYYPEVLQLLKRLPPCGLLHTKH